MFIKQLIKNKNIRIVIYNNLFATKINYLGHIINYRQNNDLFI